MTRFRPPGAPHPRPATPAAPEHTSQHASQITLNLRLDLPIDDIAIVVTMTRPADHVPQDEYEVAGLNTIRQAQAILQDEGLIVAEQGRGTFVIALPAPVGDLAMVREAVEDLRSAIEAAQAALGRISRHLGPATA